MHNSFKKLAMLGLPTFLVVLMITLSACGGSTSSTANGNQPTATFAPLPSPRATTAPGSPIANPGTPTAIPTTGPVLLPTTQATGTPTTYTSEFKGSMTNQTLSTKPSSDLILDVTVHTNVVQTVTGTFTIGIGYFGEGKSGNGSFEGFMTIDGTIYLALKPLDKTQGAFMLNGTIDPTALKANGSFQESRNKTGTWELNRKTGVATATGTIAQNDGSSGDLSLTITNSITPTVNSVIYGIEGNATFSNLLGGGPMIGTLSAKGLNFAVIGQDIQSLTIFTDPSSGSSFGGTYVITTTDASPNIQNGTWSITIPTSN